MDKINIFESKIERLKQSPIYAMSLGSKELFHSNFWAWLIDNNHIFAKVFFPNIDASMIDWVGRECKHRDVSIYMKDQSCYVIENKIKSIPMNEQLIKYYENTKKFEHGILSGIKETLDIEDKEHWSFLSYENISKNIRNILTSNDKIIIHTNEKLIYDYCDILLLLSDVVLDSLEQTEGILEYNTRHLADIRFDDVYKKFKSEEFLQKYLINSSELHDIVPSGFKLITRTDFSHKHAIIDIRFDMQDKIVIGVQIEGNQFRIVAQKNIPNNCNEVYNDFLEYEWFDSNYDKLNHIFIFDNETSMRPRNGKTFNKYETSRYSFVYQYFNLTDQTKQYDVLYKMILKYMNEASKIASSISKNI